LIPSLSVILPVFNAEATLAAVALKLLEILPDLAGRFEILIVDDASTDQTAEIAHELRRTYPQVRVLRHGWQWGLAAALLTGRNNCQGDMVLVLHRHDASGLRELVRQWQRQINQPADRREHVSSRRDSAEAQPWVRTEQAHVGLAALRETSFLRHLRQLSAVEPR
jgi:dolichol-phosphate mannosyltransferase